MRQTTIFRAAICAIFIALAALPLSVSAQTTEHIVSFNAAAHVGADRMVTVTETIAYDFGDTDHHGIYRDIPEQYSRNGVNYDLRLQLKSVLLDGDAVPYTTSRSDGVFHVQIGDANQLINGKHLYVISYQTNRAINFFSDHSEFYWNVTGNGWNVPIDAAQITVSGPQGWDAVSSQSACYTGEAGSSLSDCTVTGNGSTATVVTTQGLYEYEGLTVVFSFPKGMIAEPGLFEKIGMVLADNSIFFLPIAVFIIMFLVWWFFGKDPKGKGTIVPQYEPPRGLTPMEMYGLVHQDVTHAAVTATIIDLARRGYLKIIYTEKKGLMGSSTSYEFEKGKDQDDTILSHEKWLLDGLFGGGIYGETATRVSMDSLKNRFYTFVKNANDAAMISLRSKGLMSSDPIKVRGIFWAIGLLFIIIGIRINGPFHSTWSVVLSWILTGVIIGVFGMFMSRKTKDGAIALEEVEGFKWFLSVTEKDRLAFTDAPKLQPETFHQFLSYAIALGVEKQWAGQFAHMDVPPPTYATGYGTWNTLFFISSLQSFDTQARGMAYAPPSGGAGSGMSGFGGGGFSGGGFGGGGGGSW